MKFKGGETMKYTIFAQEDTQEELCVSLSKTNDAEIAQMIADKYCERGLKTTTIVKKSGE